MDAISQEDLQPEDYSLAGNDGDGRAARLRARLLRLREYPLERVVRRADLRLVDRDLAADLVPEQTQRFFFGGLVRSLANEHGKRGAGEILMAMGWRSRKP